MAGARPEPVPAVFQGQDLRPYSVEIAARGVAGSSFFGCRLGAPLADAADAAGCLVLHAAEGLPFDPFRSALYTPDELYSGFDPADPTSYRRSLDAVIYESFMRRSPEGKPAGPKPVDTEVTLMRRLHDASIAEALDDLLDPATRLRSVAVLGGHDSPRNSQVYRRIAGLAQRLAELGYRVLTGGGPGLMEAANLGAYTAGFDDPDEALDAALALLAPAPVHDDPLWVSTAWQARTMLGRPDRPEVGRTIGIPTWFYGHEPPNMFATDIAKYFENSVREEGLLAVAQAGAIFAEGNAGTVQEIFQDACQNYYRTYDSLKSPMILFGADYWNPDPDAASAPASRPEPGFAALPGKRIAKPLYPLLALLGAERDFADYLLVTDDTDEIVRFLVGHPPVGAAAASDPR